MKYNIDEIISDEFGKMSPDTKRDYCLVIDSYNKFIKSMLTRGLDVEIEGIGVLHPYLRKVKNKFGRDYSIKVELKQNPGFKDTLLDNYTNNNEIFKRKR